MNSGVFAHELFHTFYQPDGWFRNESDVNIEGWAFYVQTLRSSQHEIGGMAAAVERAKKFLGRIPQDVIDRALAHHPFDNQNGADQEVAYTAAAMPLLGMPLAEVQRLYQDLRSKYSNPCSHLSGGPSRRRALAFG